MPDMGLAELCFVTKLTLEMRSQGTATSICSSFSNRYLPPADNTELICFAAETDPSSLLVPAGLSLAWMIDSGCKFHSDKNEVPQPVPTIIVLRTFEIV